MESMNDKGTKTEEGSETLVSEGIVYKITCNLTGKCYYGSTVQTLAKRESVHKLNSNTATSKQLIQNGNWKIEMIEEVVFKHKLELLQRERFYIDNDDNSINKNRPYVTADERKVQIQQNMKKWYLGHREDHIRKMTQYNLDHLEAHRMAMRKYSKKCRIVKKQLKNIISD